MAGIGFRLRRLAEERGLLGFIASYSAASAIMAGPWIITVLTVIGVTLLGHSMDLARFDTYITHIYQVSLITVGFLQFPATRYLADLLFTKNYRKVFPAFATTLGVSLLCTSLIGVAWATTTPTAPILERVLAVSLLNVVTAQWVSLIFLVSVHSYGAILAAFLFGGVLSISAVTMVFGANSALSLLAGYTIGQLLTLAILLGVLMKEYPSYSLFDPQALVWVKRYPSLPLAGGFFYLGIFADKFAYRYGSWLSSSPMVGHEVVAPWLYISEPYEFLNFIGQLTVIPALAVFYIRVETGFFEVYKAFYKAIDERKTLAELKFIKQEILSEIKRGAKAVGASQMVISLLFFLVAPELFPNRVLSPMESDILRASIVSSYFAILLLLIVVLLLYFEFYRDAFWISSIYAVLNYTLTTTTLLLSEGSHGWSAAAASFICCLIAARVLWVKVDDLLYQTFSKSPVETLPEKVRGIPGVGRFHVKKEKFEFHVEA